MSEALPREEIIATAVRVLPDANPFDTLYSFTETQLCAFARALAATPTEPETREVDEDQLRRLWERGRVAWAEPPEVAQSSLDQRLRALSISMWAVGDALTAAGGTAEEHGAEMIGAARMALEWAGEVAVPGEPRG